jgi:hypothetical protein
MGAHRLRLVVTQSLLVSHVPALKLYGCFAHSVAVILDPIIKLRDLTNMYIYHIHSSISQGFLDNFSIKNWLGHGIKV